MKVVAHPSGVDGDAGALQQVIPDRFTVATAGEQVICCFGFQVAELAEGLMGQPTLSQIVSSQRPITEDDPSMGFALGNCLDGPNLSKNCRSNIGAE